MPYRKAPQGWWREFVGALPARTATCAVTLADGSPHATPVWVTLDGPADGLADAPDAETRIVFTTYGTSVKGRALRRDPRLSLCWDDERPPFSFVTVLGAVELLDDPDQVRHWAGVLGGRYMGADRAEEYARRNGVPGELLVRVTPVRVIAVNGVAD
jgi:PPOX class probable F420-dependent enzyme